MTGTTGVPPVGGGSTGRTGVSPVGGGSTGRTGVPPVGYGSTGTTGVPPVGGGNTGRTGVPSVGGGNTGTTGVPPVASNTFVYSYLPGTDLVSGCTCGGFSRTIAYEPYRDLLSAITNRFGSRVISTFEYTNDAAGRRVAISRGGDAMGPLSDGDVTYTYDAAGNRMTRTENCETITYTLGVGDRLASYGRAGAPRTPQSVKGAYTLGVGDRLASYGRAGAPRTPQSVEGAYTHDAAGNVTRIERDGRPTLDLTWNSQYQLVLVSTNGVFAEGYAYDALNRRVSTTTLEGTTRHVYDNNWQCIADIEENGNVVASYTWGDGIDKLLAVTIGGATYYPLTDVHGTVWGYVDSQNNIVARWQYDAWGNVISEEVAPSAVVLATLRYRFQGREWSVATSLINFREGGTDAEHLRQISVP